MGSSPAQRSRVWHRGFRGSAGHRTGLFLGHGNNSPRSCIATGAQNSIVKDGSESKTPLGHATESWCTSGCVAPLPAWCTYRGPRRRYPLPPSLFRSEPMRSSRNSCLAAPMRYMSVEPSEYRRLRRRRAEGMRSERALQCVSRSTDAQSPYNSVRRSWRATEKSFDAAAPANTVFQEGIEWHQAQRALGSEVAGIGIADPPACAKGACTSGYAAS